MDQPALTAAEPTFTHTLADGSTITVGKPKGVLRLRLRALLGDLYGDEEMKTMGTAFLSIQKWGGAPAPLLNQMQFSAMMNRFADDEDLDLFMEKWQRLTQPEMVEMISQTLDEALEKNLSEEATQALLRERVMPLARARMQRLKDSPLTPTS